VLLGDGHGGFGPPLYFNFGTSFFFGQPLADFNNDNKLDLITGDRIALGNGDGTFGTPIKTGIGATGFAVGDLDNDGNNDVVFQNTIQNSSANSSVLLGNGDGTFRRGVDFPLDDGKVMTLGDINGDGHLDLVATAPERIPPTVSVFLGKGDGTFSGSTEYAVGANPSGIALADMNGDGMSGRTTANQAESVTVLLGDGQGNFSEQTRTDYVVPEPFSLALGDLDG